MIIYAWLFPFFKSPKKDGCLQVGGHEHNTNSVEGNSETMSTNSASSPIPYMHNHSNDANDINEKRRHKSSSEDSKVSSQTTFGWEVLVKISNMLEIRQIEVRLALLSFDEFFRI